MGCFGGRHHGYIQCTLDMSQSVFMEKLIKDNREGQIWGVVCESDRSLTTASVVMCTLQGLHIVT